MTERAPHDEGLCWCRRCNRLLLLKHAAQTAIEAAAWAIHTTFWNRTYGEETGTAASVARRTWGAAKEARMAEAAAAIAAASAFEQKENK